jgi:hypothetical protein
MACQIHVSGKALQQALAPGIGMSFQYEALGNLALLCVLPRGLGFLLLLKTLALSAAATCLNTWSTQHALCSDPHRGD